MVFKTRKLLIYTFNQGPLEASLRTAFNNFKRDAEKELFVDKKHFPQELRQMLKVLVNIAEDADLIDDNLVAHIQSCVPYNTFTIKVGLFLLFY